MIDSAEAFLRSIVKPDAPLTARQVGVLLGMHRNSVKRIPGTSLPYFRVGSRGDRRYHKRDVDAYVALRAVR